MWVIFCEFPINNEKRKNQFKTKKFTITIQIVSSSSATPSFKKSLRGMLYTWPVISPFACSMQRIFNKLGLIARYYQFPCFTFCVSHNNVWRHWRKNFLEEFCLLIVIILLLLHNYFIIPKLASTRSNRAKGVQGRSTVGVKNEERIKNTVTNNKKGT